VKVRPGEAGDAVRPTDGRQDRRRATAMSSSGGSSDVCCGPARVALGDRRARGRVVLLSRRGVRRAAGARRWACDGHGAPRKMLRSRAAARRWSYAAFSAACQSRNSSSLRSDCSRPASALTRSGSPASLRTHSAPWGASRSASACCSRKRAAMRPSGQNATSSSPPEDTRCWCGASPRSCGRGRRRSSRRLDRRAPQPAPECALSAHRHRAMVRLTPVDPRSKRAATLGRPSEALVRGRTAKSRSCAHHPSAPCGRNTVPRAAAPGLLRPGSRAPRAACARAAPAPARPRGRPRPPHGSWQ
jgi:hypothetical protein